jgi:hypothetical protein
LEIQVCSLPRKSIKLPSRLLSCIIFHLHEQEIIKKCSHEAVKEVSMGSIKYFLLTSNFHTSCAGVGKSVKIENPTIDNQIVGFFVVHLTDQLSNFGIIPDYLKVVDFIEEIDLHPIRKN